jgi:hypothetical protein
MKAYANDNDIEYDDNEIEDDDDKIEDDDAHEESETQRDGARFIKKKHGRSIDHKTVSANPLDSDLLPAPEQEEVVVRRGKKAEDDDKPETELARSAADKTAKQQISEKLAAAQAKFGKLPKEPRVSANDNFRPIVSWPLMDQLTRKTFEPDRERRTKVIATARYLRDLIDMDGADALGNDKDCEPQRTESGKVFFEHGQTFDRKKVIFDSKDGESDAQRYSGSVRTAKNSGPVSNSGFDPTRDEPLAVRIIVAREELDAIIAAVGPLWPSLRAAISENATMTEIGLAAGSPRRFQASREGTAIIRRALAAAMETLSRLNEIKDEPRRATPLPVKSRGSFLNQSSGPVIKVAA